MDAADNPAPRVYTAGFAEERMRAAFESRRRNHWPDFEAAMLDPILSRLILIEALHGAIDRHDTARRAAAAPPPLEAVELVREEPTRQSFTRRRKDDGPHWWDAL